MKTELIRRSVMIIACLAVVGMLTGCDQAEQALEKTDLGATTEATKLITKATAALEISPTSSPPRQLCLP